MIFFNLRVKEDMGRLRLNAEGKIKSWSFCEWRLTEQTERHGRWLAAASGDSTGLQVWYGKNEITSSRLSDLLSCLLVPASSAWRDQACPDHNYVLSHLPVRPPTANPNLRPSSYYSKTSFTFYTSVLITKWIASSHFEIWLYYVF